MDWNTFMTRKMRELKDAIPAPQERMKEIGKQWTEYKRALKSGSAGTKTGSLNKVDEMMCKLNLDRAQGSGGLISNGLRLIGLGYGDEEQEPEGGSGLISGGLRLIGLGYGDEGGSLSNAEAQRILTEAELKQAKAYRSRFAKNSDGNGSMLDVLDAKLRANEDTDPKMHSSLKQTTNNNLASMGSLGGNMAGAVTGEILAEPSVRVGGSLLPQGYITTHGGPDAYSTQEGGSLSDFVESIGLGYEPQEQGKGGARAGSLSDIAEAFGLGYKKGRGLFSDGDTQSFITNTVVPIVRAMAHKM